MKTKSLAGMVLSICLVLAFGVAPAAGSSMGGRAPVRPVGANADGYADLAIGIPGRDVSTFNAAGMVGVVYGDHNGPAYNTAQLFDLSTTGITGNPGLNNNFGKALAGGDFNRDGYLDLAIGVPGKTVNSIANAGSITILWGASGGYTGSNSTYWDQTSLGTNIAETGDHFGAALASGDFNGDGYDDLAIGAPGQDFLSTFESAGRVDVMYGSAYGLTSTDWDAVYQGLIYEETPEEGDNFGSVLAAGDFNGDSYGDLAIGVPNEDLTVGVDTFSDAGVVQVVYGSPDGLSSDGDTLLYQGHDGLYDTPDDYDKFGYSLAAGYFNENQYEDLAIGVPQEDYFGADAGVVHIVWGYVGAISTDSDLLLDQAWISGQSNDADDLFGWALAAGDFNGDGKDDLAVGVPGEDISTYNQVGTMHVLYGSFSYIEEDFTLDNPYTLRDFDQWGYSLAAGDINADGYDDLVVGTPLYDINDTVTNSGAMSWMLGSEDGVDASTHYMTFIAALDASLTPEQSDQFGYALVVLDEPHTLIEFLYLPVVSK